MYETVHFVNRNNDRKKDINYAELFALLTEFKMTLQADRPCCDYFNVAYSKLQNFT